MGGSTSDTGAKVLKASLELEQSILDALQALGLTPPSEGYDDDDEGENQQRQENRQPQQDIQKPEVIHSISLRSGARTSRRLIAR